MPRYLIAPGVTREEPGPIGCLICAAQVPTENGVCPECLSAAAEYTEADEVADYLELQARLEMIDER